MNVNNNMEMKKSKVLVVGELNVDLIYDNIEGLPIIGKEKLAKNFTFTLGSSSAIFASNLSTLGTQVSFLGKVGNDEFARTVRKSLSEKGVITDYIITSDKYNTGSTMVLNYNMDRAMITYPGAMEHLLAEEITENILVKFDHLHLSSIFLQKALKPDVVALFEKAKNLGLSTSLDPQWDPAEKWNLNLQELLPFVDIFLPNAKEFLFLTKSETIAEGLRKLEGKHKSIVIKDGDNGAHLWDGIKLISKPAFLNTNVVDCIGAGDSFDAGFIDLYLKGSDLLTCLQRGNIIGAVNTSCSGGTGAFQSKQQVVKIAKENFSFELT
ncbi:Sugar or nucleoside kinase, ribokinase family [Reichenbachiella faecimaris]|uniref:Sugar or nucleoside kinase, ribokinase family n=2 Tax=Reichenbachiella faecimaris TaxID=692418 RepID=A0A1W2G825_REIFA|nr:Sugar or nucleoside kinase, ribokinase family [Reichenbachiella faecimaris]